MKPFNLEKFLEGEPAITRDGRKVIDWHYFKGVPHAFKLYALLSDGAIIIYTISGNVYFNGDKNNLDLFMEEKKVDLWIATYKTENNIYVSYTYNDENKEDLNIFIKNNPTLKITVNKITIKE